MLADDDLVRASFAELAAIARWAAERGSGESRLALIGGWAVHAYNGWFGSQDIDFLGTGRVRGSLLMWLRAERGYVPDRSEGAGVRAVAKSTPAGRIVVEFLAPDDDFRFEGNRQLLPLRPILKRHRWRRLESAELPVLDPEALFLLKMKAAWDRGYRVEHETSSETERDRTKWAKDAGDLLALLDPERGPTLDLGVLAHDLGPYPFLPTLLESEGFASAGAQRYGLPPTVAREWFGRLRGFL